MEDSGFVRVVPLFRFWLILTKFIKKNSLILTKHFHYKLPFLFPSTPNKFKKYSD